MMSHDSCCTVIRECTLCDNRMHMMGSECMAEHEGAYGIVVCKGSSITRQLHRMVSALMPRGERSACTHLELPTIAAIEEIQRSVCARVQPGEHTRHKSQHCESNENLHSAHDTHAAYGHRSTIPSTTGKY